MQLEPGHCPKRRPKCRPKRRPKRRLWSAQVRASTLALALASLSVAFLSGCGSYLHSGSGSGSGSGSATGIVGGKEVPATDPIAMRTAMLLDVQQGSLCTASILNSHWLVTAGHCVYSSKIDDLVVVFAGTSDDFVYGRTPRAEIRRVTATFTNPQYNATVQAITAIVQKAKQAGKDSSADVDAVKGWGDLGLVQIDGVIPHGKLSAAFLPAGMALTKDEPVSIAGYGQDNIDVQSPTGAGVLREVLVNLLDPAWGPGEVLLDNSNGKGSCHGDSGGPAYAKINGQLYLFAITSHLVGDSLTQQCQHSAAYTTLSAYQDWITSTISANKTE